MADEIQRDPRVVELRRAASRVAKELAIIRSHWPLRQMKVHPETQRDLERALDKLDRAKEEDRRG